MSAAASAITICPPSMGGGLDLALKDFDTAISLNPKWTKATLERRDARKVNRDAEARRGSEPALELNPNRVWIKQQLDKTPAK